MDEGIQVVSVLFPFGQVITARVISVRFLGRVISAQVGTNNLSLLYLCISRMFTEFSSYACPVEQRNGKFVFSGTFHIMWVEVGQGILLNRSIFLNKSDQLCINTVIILNIGTPRPATTVVLKIKQFNFTLK